jgi:tripartite-type tricarboxylate transporter receptor subunit TctC
MKRMGLLLAALAFSGAVIAQTFPNRPVRMVIPWPPGQATDLAGRVLAQKLSEIWNQQVVADNRAGAGGMIGTDVAAKAAPDGYTLLAASSGPVTINPQLQKSPYDSERDLAPVANVGLSPYVLVTNPQFPATNAREFVALVKANPGKYSFASSGTGATAHLVAEWFNNMAGLQVTHVPYKGSSPALTDVIGGQIAYAIETAAATMPHVKSGRLKAYGVSLARGSALTPGIEPLATAANLPGFDVGAWIGVMVPMGTPRPIVDRIAAAVEKAMQSAEVRERIEGIGVEVNYRRTEEFTRYLKEQHARFADIIKKGNIKLE